MDVTIGKMVPEMIWAQEEDIDNERGEAGVLSEHRMPVDAYEPVAEDARHRGLAVDKAVNGHEVLEEEREKTGLAARLIDGSKAADVVIRLPQLACLNLLHQVPHVEDHTDLLFRPAMLTD